MEDASRDLVSLQGTGSTATAYLEADYAIGDYVVTVRFRPDGTFLGVVRVSLSRDFRSREQKLASRGYHDVTDLYEE